MELKNIIQEELNKILNESYVMEHENFRFRQEIKDSSFYNYDSFTTDFDADIAESNIFINWHIGFQLNEFGIERFVVGIDSVEGTYRYNLYNKQSDELEQESDKNINDHQWKFNVGDPILRLNKPLYIETLDFDFKTKICSVTFLDSENY